MLSKYARERVASGAAARFHMAVTGDEASRCRACPALTPASGDDLCRACWQHVTDDERAAYRAHIRAATLDGASLVGEIDKARAVMDRVVARLRAMRAKDAA